jgi:hypothetical protein
VLPEGRVQRPFSQTRWRDSLPFEEFGTDIVLSRSNGLGGDRGSWQNAQTNTRPVSFY